MGNPLIGRLACFGSRYASAFRESSVADAYGFRPPYPPAVFEVLATLLPTRPYRILDVGCGTGALARSLISFGVPIDAVDVSPVMIARGRCLPNGTHSLIHWMVGAEEEVPLTPPYDLVTAGESLHWMEWETVLPRFNSLLSPDGRLVILELGHQPVPWDDQLAIRQPISIARSAPWSPRINLIWSSCRSSQPSRGDGHDMPISRGTVEPAT
jgi:2-polyprenyl-3-methyl-5-hydroxy-6-metoxy-1,4-benzoquinol methylase